MSTAAITSALSDLAINSTPQKCPFPAKSKQVSGTINGIPTAISSIYFSDKIMITISQAGRLSQWIQVPLSSASPTHIDTALPPGSDDLLPMAHLTPKTLMGGGGEEREMIGHLYATQIASLISTQNAEERRTVLLGIGLQKIDMAREAWFDVLELVQQVVI